MLSSMQQVSSNQDTVVNNDFLEEEIADNSYKIKQEESSAATEILNENLLPNNNNVKYEIIKESSCNNNASCSMPKKLADLASDILLYHCMYMIENCELKRSNISSDTLNSHSHSSNETCYNPRKLSDIILVCLGNNPEYKIESIASADFTRNETKNNHLEVNASNFVISTPFKTYSKGMENKDFLSESNKLFSFVSEGDEVSDSQTTVILGSCEVYALGLYSRLETTFEQYYDDDRPEEEILQLSSNFVPLSDESIVESQYFPNKEADAPNATVDFSLETWDRVLGKTLQVHEDGPASIFDHDNFTPRNYSLDIFNKTNPTTDIIRQLENQSINLPNVNKTLNLVDKLVINDEIFNIDEEMTKITINETLNKQEQEEDGKNRIFIFDEIKDEVPNIEDTEETSVLNSWEPGEGWFLHPQVPPESLTGDIDISGSDITDENSYIRFALDEECLNSLRNELAAKLPHAQGFSHVEEQLEPDKWDSEERNGVIVKYNICATPFSSIPKDSCCEDAYCDQIQYQNSLDSDNDLSESGLGQTSQLEAILEVDTESHTAHLPDSLSLCEPQHHHTPNQDSCCSNDTLFNVEDLNYGLVDNDSPMHHRFHKINAQNELNKEIQIEIAECVTPKQETPTKIYDIDNSMQQSESNAINNDSIELNLTYTNPDINIDISENDNSNKEKSTNTINSSPAIIEDPDDVVYNKFELILDPGTFGVAPLPSPKDVPWKPITASLLTYNEIMHSKNDKYEMQKQTEDHSLDNNLTSEETTEKGNDKLDDDLSVTQKECTMNADLYSNLIDIKFSGPFGAQLMSTSFSESVEYGNERDWHSGSDTRPSSSGEFIWKGVTEDINPMDATAEEKNSSEDINNCEEDMEETEVVPSVWDAKATPTKSALRSPEKSSKHKNQQKRVSFKKQKYHFVYEYPREPESPVQPISDLWRPLSDFSNFSDWELDPDACVPHYHDNPLDRLDGPYVTVLDRFIPKPNYSLSSGTDLYQLNPFPDSNITGMPPLTKSSTEFIPGQAPKNNFIWQDYQSSSSQSSRDLSDNKTPDSAIDDVTPASLTDAPNLNDMAPPTPSTNKVHSLKHLAALAEKKNSANTLETQEALAGRRHTRYRLKLDLPPSPNSFTSNRTFSIGVTSNPVINREMPTFRTFGKTRFSVHHVPTPADDSDSSSTTGRPATMDVSFEALPHKPHIPPTNTVYIVNNPEEGDTQKLVVESVQGGRRF